MNRKNLLLVFIAVAIVVVIALIVEAYFTGKNSGPIASNGTYSFQLTAHDRTIGSPKAPVVMVEYAAPTCPVCAYFDMNIFPEIKKNYIDAGKVYYVFRVFPLSSVDVAAEGIARCLPPADYFPFIEMLYHNQPKWDPDGHDIPDVHAALIQMAAVAGMGAKQADACMNNTAEQQKISQIAQDAQTQYGIQATPTFFVDGEKRVGPGSWDDWKSYLDKKVAKK